MRTLVIGVGVGLLVAGAGAAIGLAMSQDVEPVPTTPSLTVAELEAPFEAVMERLDRLETRLAATERVRRAPASKPAGAVDLGPLFDRLTRIEEHLTATPEQADSDWDARVLGLEERVVAALDAHAANVALQTPADRFAELSTLELSARARVLAESKEPGDRMEAADAFAALLDRRMSHDERRNAWRDLGSLLYDSKDYDGAARVRRGDRRRGTRLTRRDAAREQPWVESRLGRQHRERDRGIRLRPDAPGPHGDRRGVRAQRHRDVREAARRPRPRSRGVADDRRQIRSQ
jgi:hypothetical protein